MRRYKLAWLSLAACCGLTGAAAAADGGAAIDGQLAFNNNCRTCHSTDAGDNRLGPNLHGIVGRKAAAADGYGYSSAFRSADFAWTADKLDRFIADPGAVVPGNNMKPYSGIDDAAVREAIISHLERQ